MNLLGGGRGGRRGSRGCRLRRNCGGCSGSRGGSLDRNGRRCDRSRRRGVRLDDGRSFGHLRLTFAGRRRSRWRYWRLHHDGDWGWHDGNGRTCGGYSCGSLGNDWPDGRLARDGARSRWRRCDDGRRLPYRRHDLSWFRASGRGCRGRSCDNGRGWFGRRRRRCNGRWPRRGLDPSSPGFVLLFLGQDGFHHVAGLGDMRQIDLGRHPLGTA